MKTRTRKGNAVPADTQEYSTPHLVTRQQIERRAHEIWIARGGSPGRELDDWLQAEQELKTAVNPAATI
jgi:hypothetical protein